MSCLRSNYASCYSRNPRMTPSRPCAHSSPSVALRSATSHPRSAQAFQRAQCLQQGRTARLALTAMP
eukprot:scaffold10098_cov107-Isochrysis_galbana.AAC.1